MLRRVKSWLAERSAKALESIGLSVLLVGILTTIVGIIVAALTSPEFAATVIGISSGLGTGLMTTGIGLYLSPDPASQPNKQGARGEVTDAFVSLIRNAARSKFGLRICGIANSDFFGPNPRLLKDLCELLNRGKLVRILILDPECTAAQRRQQWLGAVHAIRQCRTEIRRLREKYKNLQFRQHQVPACYLCLNANEVIGHPYFTSVDGHETPTFQAYAGSPVYFHALRHFENLWGQRWALVDLGNVLLRFDHHRISESICAKVLASKLPDTEAALYRFIFEDGRNAKLDSGECDLAWLAAELNREFSISPQLNKKLLDKLWCCTFDPAPVKEAVDCLHDLKANDVRLMLCSNTNNSHWAYIRRTHHRLTHIFDRVCLSYEQRQTKTSPDYWHTVLSLTNARREEHLFVDDLQVHVDSAKTAGLNGSLIRNPNELREAFEIHGWL